LKPFLCHRTKKTIIEKKELPNDSIAFFDAICGIPQTELTTKALTLKEVNAGDPAGQPQIGSPTLYPQIIARRWKSLPGGF
jgi:hypothetical protein